MAAEHTRAPLAVREHRNMPAIERAKPTVNVIPEALEQTSCSLERLKVLLQKASGDLHHIMMNVITDLDQPLGEAGARRLESNWIIFDIAGGMLADLEETISAIVIKAFEDRESLASAKASTGEVA